MTGHGVIENAAIAGQVELVRMRAYRKSRIAAALCERGLAAAVLFNPINMRYACDARNMQVYGLHNACRCVFVGADGYCVLFEFRNCEHLSAHLETIQEIRPARSWYHMAAGDNGPAVAMAFAKEIADLSRTHGGADCTVAFDRIDLMGMAAMQQQGVTAVDGLELMDFARLIKSPDEVSCIRDAIVACETGLRRMQAAHLPGITEQALWSVLAHANTELGGEWMETRLLSAGPRTNPWYNECGEHVIREGDLVSFDTDLVGRHGYSVDISRSWLTGEGMASEAQCRLYSLAYAQITHNIAQLRPGRRFSEVAQLAFRVPDRFVPRMNRAIAHGIGLCNEYPLIVNAEFAAGSYDGELREGMVLCVESFVGDAAGGEGVKLEEQVLVTAGGALTLSQYPFERRLM